MDLNMMTDIERRNATDGKCHNTLTSGRECDAPAEWLGVTRMGHAYGFCDACAMRLGFRAYQRRTRNDTMARLPSIKSLRELFGDDAPVAREYLECCRAKLLDLSEAVRKRDGESYNPPPTYVLRMEALAELGAKHGVYGVEAVQLRNGRYVDYLNTGDPYSVTLLRYPSGTYRIGCWGDIANLA